MSLKIIDVAELRRERRFQILKITGELLREIVASLCVSKERYTPRVFAVEGVPDGVFIDGPIEGRSKSWEYRDADDEILFRVYHPDFPPVQEGACAPNYCPVIRELSE